MAAVSAVKSSDTRCFPERWTSGDLSDEQRDDPHLSPIMAWMEQGAERPPWSEFQGASQAVRSLWSQWDQLEQRDGVLYRHWESDNGSQKSTQLVLPRSLVPDALRALHDAPTAGHLGITKTLNKVQARFYWHGWRADVEDWCRQCSTCATGKSSKRSGRAPLVINRAGYPLERMAVDVLGPFPATETGNKYVLVVGDYFTKWTEAYAVPNQEAKTLARKIVDEFVCRFGAPEILHSDQGRNFESTLFKEMCTMLDIRKTRTTAYHPESDSMVERFNRTLAAMLSKYVAKHQKDWDMYLPQVMMAYRSSEHESTKYTPHRLMIGREIHLPVDVMFGRVPDHQPELSQYVRELRESSEEAYEYARENLQAPQQRQKAYYDQRATGTPFQVGYLVWLWVKKIKKGQTRKLTELVFAVDFIRRAGTSFGRDFSTTL